MKSITCAAKVDSGHKATTGLPDDIQPGVYTLRLYVEERQQALASPLEGLPTVRAWEWLKDVSLRRGDMYGDERG